MLNFEKCQGLLAKAKDPARGKPIANNTRIVALDNRAMAVRLHQTNVVVFHGDGSITLDSGGWRTPTTKQRINDALGQRGYVSTERGLWTLHMDGEAHPFKDGIHIGPKGKVSGAGKTKDVAEEKQLRKRVAAYTKAFIEALFKGEVGAPGPGDCFYCQMREVKTGIPLGEFNKDRSHILSHIEEDYFVPSLLARALEVTPCSLAEKQTAHALMEDKPEYAFQTDPKGFVAQGIEKRLRKYVFQQLGMAA